MAGLLDTILNQVMPGPSKNPYGGLLSDAQYQQYRKRKLGENISSTGDFLMRAAMGDSSGGRSRGGQGGLLDMIKMGQYQQAQQRGRGQAASREALTAGNRYDPEKGILWDTPPQPGQEPRGILESERGGLLQRAYPEAYGKAMMEQAFPKQPAMPAGFESDPAGGMQPIQGGPASIGYLGEKAGATRAPDKPDLQYTGDPQWDAAVGKFYQINPKSGKREYTSPLTGMEITTPEGLMVRTGVRTGGADKGLTKSNRTFINKEIMKSDAALERLDNIKSSWNPEWNTLEKRADLKWAAFKEKTFGEELSPETVEELTAFSEGSSNAISNINTIIHDLTGAQMSVYEAKRLRLPEPDPGEGIWPADSPTEFAAKLDARYKAIEKVRARYRYYTQKGVYDKAVMAGKSPLDSMKVFVNPQTGERIVEIDGNWVPL